jgi:hypothetical protein
VGNSPANRVDPTGLFWEELGMAVWGYGWRTGQEVVDEYARRFDQSSVATITYKPGLSAPGAATGYSCAFANIEIGPDAFAFWNPSYLVTVMGHEIHHANDYRVGIRQNLESRAVKWEIDNMAFTGFTDRAFLERRYQRALARERVEDSQPLPFACNDREAFYGDGALNGRK